MTNSNFLNAAFISFYCLEGHLLQLVSHTVIAVHCQAFVKDYLYCLEAEMSTVTHMLTHRLKLRNTNVVFNKPVFLQTILVGDSGVGKTSLLVQFDQGKFIPGSFSATVGIGFTVCVFLYITCVCIPLY